MDKDDIKIGDWVRVILGEVPPVFLIEIILRTIVVYSLLMFSFRMMGSRMASQLNRIEQASLVTLAAAIGVPIQSPERGIVPPLIIALVVVISARLIARRASRNEKFERQSQGKADTLVENSVLCNKTVGKTTLTRERIFAQLRSKRIVHLGQVKRFYLEANGSFTLIKNGQAQPGLAILPEYDQDFLKQFPRSGEKVCSTCGNKKMQEEPCENCGDICWEYAINNRS
jgi:uncharacterized membrane protein YcaP (DUF421 family)